MEQTTVLAERDSAIDVCKTIAIIGVVVIHTCIVGFSYEIGSFNWISTLFWGSMTRASVPLFFMCSGALLLNPQKDLSVKKFFHKNVLRILVALFCWAVAYKAFFLVATHRLTPVSIWQACKEIILFSHESHLYYLHILILGYLFVPIARLFVKNATDMQMQYALAFWFVFAILYPTVITFWPFTLLKGIPVQWMMNMTYASIGYGLLGYYLKAHPIRSAKVSILLCVAGFLEIAIGTWYFSAQQGTLYLHFLNGMTVGVCLLAAGIYSMCFLGNREYSKRAGRYFGFFSKASFCIFLVHIFFISCLGHLDITVKLLPCLVSIPLIAALNICLSVMAYLIISRIPLLNRWII